MEKKLEILLDGKSEMTTSDFFRLFPGVPTQTVYSRIRRLIDSGRLEAVGKGKYRTLKGLDMRYSFSQALLDIHRNMVNDAEGISFCLSEKNGNVFVEVPYHNIDNVVNILRSHHILAFRDNEAEFPMADISGITIVKPLVSESPLSLYGGVPVPSIEKSLVDMAAENTDPISLKKEFQYCFETYTVNQSRLLRYAGRRNKRAEIQSLMDGVDQGRVKMFSDIRNYLRTIPVEKAWVFGSYSRCEETENSDLDLLVKYSYDESLLKRIRYRLDLENIVGREVDLIEDGQLIPAAISSANTDKRLVYEK